MQTGGWRLATGERIGGTIVTLILAFPFLPPLPASEAESAKEGKPSLRDYARESQFRFAFGIYLGKRKLGWMMLESKLGEHEGKEVLFTTMEMRARISFAGDTTDMDARERLAYELTGEGAIVFAESTSLEDGTETRIRAVRDGEDMAVTRKSRGGETKRRVPIPRDTLVEDRKFEEWLASGPAAGDSMDTYSTDWEEDEVDQRETCIYRGRKELTWGGVKTEVFLLDLEMKGITAACEFLPDGTPIRLGFGGFMEVRAEEEARARDMSDAEQVDMLQASAIAVDRDLGEPGKIESLTLRASGIGEFKVPQSPRQRVTRSRRGRATIELRREGNDDELLPLAAEEREQYLKPAAAIPSDHEAIRARAKEIVGSEKDPLQAAGVLCRWVHANLKKTMAAEASNALDVLHSMKGDCTEHTLLFVALARAVGIPCREVGGVVYVGNAPEPSFGWHAWAEVHDGTRWVSVDPTWDQVRVDATHLKLTEGNDDWSWFSLLGKMKLRVVEVGTGG